MSTKVYIKNGVHMPRFKKHHFTNMTHKSTPDKVTFIQKVRYVVGFALLGSVFCSSVIGLFIPLHTEIAGSVIGAIAGIYYNKKSNKKESTNDLWNFRSHQNT